MSVQEHFSLGTSSNSNLNDTKKNSTHQQVLARALRINRKETRHMFNGELEILAVQDHILESACNHEKFERIESCQVCRFESQLRLPHLPEMVFPNNSLVILRNDNDKPIIEFNAFDALKRVDTQNVPSVKVGPSIVWQNARRELPFRESQLAFDWTYTSDYEGTLGTGTRSEEASPGERIDFERLKKRDPIQFYEQMTLYEDELADNGCAQMTVRIRVMPDTYFVLCRFYLRIDNVMVRTYDTRVYGTTENNLYALRETTKREAEYAQLSKEALDDVLDPNMISPHLPLIFSKTTKLYYN